jgi:hypothetical protein
MCIPRSVIRHEVPSHKLTCEHWLVSISQDSGLNRKLAGDLAICLSLDNTFKVAAKATVVNKNGTHCKLTKGGILNVINESDEIMAWVSPVSKNPKITLAYRYQRFCQSASPAEAQEVLEGIKHRCFELDIPVPEMVVVDNCCQVRSQLTKAMPDIRVVLDVHHFLMR